jgi:hypothetical protein
MSFILEMLAYFTATPPPYSVKYDLNLDGYITIADLLQYISTL